MTESTPPDPRTISNRLLLQQYGAAVAPALKRDTAAAVAGYPADDFGGALSAALPLRVGFVSSDFCDHPVGLLMLPLLLFLDRSRITPLFYSTGGRDDDTRAVLRRHSQWHDVAALDAAALTERLRADQLHIAIDLAGHTAGNRLPVFARRVAPLQISWLGYFATTGIPAMDSVLMDRWHVPPEHEDHFTEEVLRLPHSRWCYHPVAFAPEVSPPPCLATGTVTFGSFNNTAKYNDAVFAAWARILLAVPGSRLVLKSYTFDDAAQAERVRVAFEALGVVRDRLDLRPASFHRQLLEQYADIDIALDPFPFTGGYTSCEALWMGLPIVTLCGDGPWRGRPMRCSARLAGPNGFRSGLRRTRTSTWPRLWRWRPTRPGWRPSARACVRRWKPLP
jgi:predicted O-linked N-acetylglucosamine transferase (SPINDLY family)